MSSEEMPGVGMSSEEMPSEGTSSEDVAGEDIASGGRAPRLSGARVGAIVTTALLVLYMVVLGSRGVILLGSGKPAGIALGVAVLVIFALGVIAAVWEWRMALCADRMASEAAAAGLLVVDDLPRSPGGRIDRRVADEQFPARRAAVEAGPASWSAWFNLAWAYDAAGDRRRARSALRNAARLYRSR